ncbi:MAG: hypothetical protein HOO06_11275 [Bdellovibrionaceae bacterium]|jgi:hypothetical protein|nr:hypothetical protein [Pseudobdellovibrionaceae bacterium]
MFQKTIFVYVSALFVLIAHIDLLAANQCIRYFEDMSNFGHVKVETQFTRVEARDYQEQLDNLLKTSEEEVRSQIIKEKENLLKEVSAEFVELLSWVKRDDEYPILKVEYETNANYLELNRLIKKFNLEQPDNMEDGAERRNYFKWRSTKKKIVKQVSQDIQLLKSSISGFYGLKLQLLNKFGRVEFFANAFGANDLLAQSPSSHTARFGNGKDLNTNLDSLPAVEKTAREENHVKKHDSTQTVNPNLNHTTIDQTRAFKVQTSGIKSQDTPTGNAMNLLSIGAHWLRRLPGFLHGVKKIINISWTKLRDGVSRRHEAKGEGVTHWGHTTIEIVSNEYVKVKINTQIAAPTTPMTELMVMKLTQIYNGLAHDRNMLGNNKTLYVKDSDKPMLYIVDEHVSRMREKDVDNLVKEGRIEGVEIPQVIVLILSKDAMRDPDNFYIEANSFLNTLFHDPLNIFKPNEFIFADVKEMNVEIGNILKNKMFNMPLLRKTYKRDFKKYGFLFSKFDHVELTTANEFRNENEFVTDSQNNWEKSKFLRFYRSQYDMGQHNQPAKLGSPEIYIKRDPSTKELMVKMSYIANPKNLDRFAIAIPTSIKKVMSALLQNEYHLGNKELELHTPKLVIEEGRQINLDWVPLNKRSAALIDDLVNIFGHSRTLQENAFLYKFSGLETAQYIFLKKWIENDLKSLSSESGLNSVWKKSIENNFISPSDIAKGELNIEKLFKAEDFLVRP